jgi:hypothetical protein
MPDEIVEYSGFLTFPELTEADYRALEQALGSLHGAVSVGRTSLEIEYSGRDTNRTVVARLMDAAAIIGRADGEIVCQIDHELTDPEFEFYRIGDGRLLRQRGVVVRGPVEDEMPALSRGGSHTERDARLAHHPA